MTHAQMPQPGPGSKQTRLGDRASGSPGPGAASGMPRFMMAPKPEAADHSSSAGREDGEMRGWTGLNGTIAFTPHETSPCSTYIQPKLKVGAVNDPAEAEADRVADRIMRMPAPEAGTGSPAISAHSGAAPVQRVCAECEEELNREPADQTIQRQEEDQEDEEELIQTKRSDDAVQRQEDEDEDEEELIQTKEAPGAGPALTASTEGAIQSLRGGGAPLPASERAFFEPRFGRSFDNVRIHDGPRADAAAKSINARALTVGRDVVFGRGEYSPGATKGRRLLAHELTHVVQQRYGSGEHAEFGDARKEMQALIDGESIDYTVKPAERLDQIARKFGITVEALKKANSDKLKTWDAFDGSGRKIVGFNAGEKIVIPPVLNVETEAALKSSSGTSFTINGVTMDYGVGIAMGDFFESPEQMAKASKVELKKLASLITRERSGGSVSTAEWEAATGGRYLKLAEKNEAHFAPSDTSLAPASGKGIADHKTAWEKHHTSALGLSQKGKKNEALRTNAFGDHFLTDAFAGGHLINKRDIMQLFQSNLVNAKGEFTGDAEKFFDNVSKSSFKGNVKSTFSNYETVKRKWGVWRPNINSESRFATLLKGIHEKEPDVLSNAIAKAVHDALNTFSGGIPVENKMGDSWNLSGDGTLNAKSKTVALKAVAQSQLNVLGVFKAKALPLIASLLKKVWDFVPRPTKKGTKIVSGEVKSGTDPKDARLVAAVSALITSNYKTILDELVKRGILKKA